MYLFKIHINLIYGEIFFGEALIHLPEGEWFGRPTLIQRTGSTDWQVS